VRKPEEKRLIGRRRRKSVDNIKIYLIEIVWGVVDWIYLAQDGKKLLSCDKMRWLCFLADKLLAAEE
jgi:hypothetical protein